MNLLVYSFVSLLVKDLHRQRIPLLPENPDPDNMPPSTDISRPGGEHSKVGNVPFDSPSNET